MVPRTIAWKVRRLEDHRLARAGRRRNARRPPAPPERIEGAGSRAARRYPHMWWNCCAISGRAECRWSIAPPGAVWSSAHATVVAAGGGAAATAGAGLVTGVAGVSGVTGAGGKGAVAVLSASATVRPSALKVPPLSGTLLPLTAAAL